MFVAIGFTSGFGDLVTNRRDERPKNVGGEKKVKNRDFVRFSACVGVPPAAAHYEAEPVPSRNNGERAKRRADGKSEMPATLDFKHV